MRTRIILFLLLITGVTKAQTWEEFSKQKETQKKYLLQQLAALKVYAGYLKKGYTIVSDGLNTIKGFTKAEFGLHNKFFKSKRTPNPVVFNPKMLDDVFVFQLSIFKRFNWILDNKSLHKKDIKYFKGVYLNVLDECNDDIAELVLIMFPGEVEMTDDERIKRFLKIHERMQSKYLFSESIANDLKLIVTKRQQSVRDNQALQNLNGINNR